MIAALAARTAGDAGGAALTLPDVAVDISDVHVFLGEALTPVLDLERLRIERGERVAVLGPSGSGKTTLLRMINSYVLPTGGMVKVLGDSITRRAGLSRPVRRSVGFVFQRFHLIERATVFDNVLWGRLGHMGPASLLGIFPRRDREIAEAAVAEVELADKLDRRVDELSGGEQQRVGIARVVAQEAQLVLADEPVSSLDPELADEILELLVRTSKRHKTTLITTLHIPELAVQFSDRIIGLNRGRVRFDGPPEQLSEHVLHSIYDRSRPIALAEQRARALS